MPYCRIGPMFALIFIGLGTGGIKPCVSAFGGDQFNSQQVGCLHTLYSMVCCYMFILNFVFM